MEFSFNYFVKEVYDIKVRLYHDDLFKGSEQSFPGKKTVEKQPADTLL